MQAGRSDTLAPSRMMGEWWKTAPSQRGTAASCGRRDQDRERSEKTRKTRKTRKTSLLGRPQRESDEMWKEHGSPASAWLDDGDRLDGVEWRWRRRWRRWWGSAAYSCRGARVCLSFGIGCMGLLWQCKRRRAEEAERRGREDLGFPRHPRIPRHRGREMWEWVMA